MQELAVTFTPANGGPPQEITLRIGTPTRDGTSWSSLVKVSGFRKSLELPALGADWAQTVELAAKMLPVMLARKVHEAGGGTVDPPFYER